jgi:hypothetical protein
MSDKLKVTFTTINVRNNGEWTGKKDDFANFKDAYTLAGNWGLGTHNRTLRDGNLDVTVNYKIERQ